MIAPGFQRLSEGIVANLQPEVRGPAKHPTIDHGCTGVRAPGPWLRISHPISELPPPVRPAAAAGSMDLSTDRTHGALGAEKGTHDVASFES
jgi:hypothetical protein